jgi:hypothetical protein
MSWLSKKLEKSKEKGTGIYSWGETDYANFFDPTGSLDKYLDNIAKESTPKPTAKEIAGGIPVATAGYGNQEVLYAIGFLVAYKVLFK